MKCFKYKDIRYSAWQYTRLYCWIMNIIDFRFWRCECEYVAPYGKVIAGHCKKHD